MKLSKHVRYTVRVREYEIAQVEVGAEGSHFDMGLDDQMLAKLNPEEWDTIEKSLRAMVDAEVHELARSELEVISEWSEIEPNLAQDFLHTPPPAYIQRRQHHATQQKTHNPSPTSRRLRRGPLPTPPTAS
jgi:hypothetical protein